MTSIDMAKDFAVIAHAGQTRKNAARPPYTDHLDDVAQLVSQFGGTTDAIMAAWLHDTVEDCATSPQDLASQFGPTVAALVLELTDDKSLAKADRKTLQIANASRKSPQAALIKICDKLSNVRAVGALPPEAWSTIRQLAYLDWAEAVVSQLPSGADPARPRFQREVTLARQQVYARHPAARPQT